MTPGRHNGSAIRRPSIQKDRCVVEYYLCDTSCVACVISCILARQLSSWSCLHTARRRVLLLGCTWARLVSGHCRLLHSFDYTANPALSTGATGVALVLVGPHPRFSHL